MTATARDARPAGPVDLTRGYLHQVDVVRLLTFGSVIMVHTMASTTAPNDGTARAVLMLLHFTRETFFVITGFVLFHSNYRQDLDLARFWRRRFLLIGVPYVVWSVLYWLTYAWRYRSVDLRQLLVQLLTGTAEYHLYFLLVSMQVYLVFGLLVRVIRATAGHHGALLAAFAAWQLALFWLLHDVLPSWHAQPRWVAVLAEYAQQLLPFYLVYVVAGALAAVHLERTQSWVLAHGRLLAAVVIASAVVAEAVYLVQVATGTGPFRAADVLQPVMVPYALIVTAGLLWLGLRYALRRRPGGRVSAAVGEGSRISFGVFLIHPLVISLLLTTPVSRVLTAGGQPLESVLIWVLTVLVSIAAVEVFVRTPLSLALTGRRRSRGGGPRSPLTASPQPAADREGQARADPADRAPAAPIQTGSDS
jgi:peptidoglycan/LPS O-acetylase OafA/YrhL